MEKLYIVSNGNMANSPIHKGEYEIMEMKKVTRIIALVFLVGFLLPYLAVSCSGQQIAQVNGVKAAFGGSVDVSMPDMGDVMEDSDDGEIEMIVPALIALLLGVVGAVIVFAKDLELDDVMQKAVMGIYAAAAIATFLVPGSAKRQLVEDDEMEALISVDPKIGYFLTIIAAIGMIVFIYMTMKKTPTEPEIIDVNVQEVE